MKKIKTAPNTKAKSEPVVRHTTTPPGEQPKPRLLLVYEENPERMSYYLIDPIGNMARAVRQINGLLVNSDELTEEQEVIATRLVEWMATDAGKACKVETPITNVKIVEVIHTGFMM